MAVLLIYKEQQMNEPSNTSENTTSPFPPLSNLQQLAISESGFIFDPSSGHNFTVNETGLTMLRLLQKDNTRTFVRKTKRNI